MPASTCCSLTVETSCMLNSARGEPSSSAVAVTAGALIVGLGQIAVGYDLRSDPEMRVRSHARALSGHPGFELMGGVDTDCEKRQIFTELYARPAYEDLSTALVRCQPEVVI